MLLGITGVGGGGHTKNYPENLIDHEHTKRLVVHEQYMIYNTIYIFYLINF